MLKIGSYARVLKGTPAEKVLQKVGIVEAIRTATFERGNGDVISSKLYHLLFRDGGDRWVRTDEVEQVPYKVGRQHLKGATIIGRLDGMQVEGRLSFFSFRRASHCLVARFKALGFNLAAVDFTIIWDPANL